MLERKFGLKIVCSLLIIIIPSILFIVYQDEIKYSWDKYILKKEPQVVISLDQFYWMKNPYDPLNLSNEKGLKISFDDCFLDYNNCTIYKKSINGNWELILDDVHLPGILSFYTSSDLKEHGCVLNFMSKYNSPSETKSQAYFPISALIDLRDNGCKYSGDGCLINSFSAHNFGNKKLDDFKSEVCFEGKVLYVEGDINKNLNSECIETRTESFLPDDSLSGYFYVEYPNRRVNDSFYAYDEFNGDFSEKDLVSYVHLLMPDCF